MGDTVLEAWASEDTNGTAAAATAASRETVDLADAGWSLGGNGTQGSLRTYAHCARGLVTAANSSPSVLPTSMGELPPGAVALFMLNLDQRESEVRQVELSIDPASPVYERTGSEVRYEWHLAAGPEGTPIDLTTHETWLNGELLSVDPVTGALPLPLEPQTQPASAPVELAATSAAFIVIPDAGAEACM